MNKQIPNISHPGELIREELEGRGWTVSDLAQIMGRPAGVISEILNGKKSITPTTAKELGEAFGTAAEFWINLESMWQLSRAEGPNGAVKERAAIYQLAPVREMARRGWIKKCESPEELSATLAEYFGVGSLEEVPTMRAAARSSVRGEHESITPEQWAWMCRCRQVSSLVDARGYRRSYIEGVVSELRALVGEPELVEKVPNVLREAGIRLVVVEHLKQTHLDGAALHRNTKEPVIAASLRYGRLDNFWFTLFHELAHVLNEDGINADSEMYKAGEHVAEMEQRANATAAQWLIPQADLESFIRRTGPFYSEVRVCSFARRMGVHPAIVLGQLKHRGEIGWDKLARLNADVRSLVRRANVCDGWGEVAPT